MKTINPPRLVLSPEKVPGHPARTIAEAILLCAIREGATAVRLEPQEDRIRLTLQVGANEYEMLPPPAFIAPRLSQIFKVLAELDFDQRHRPRKGKLQLQIGSGIAALEILFEPTPRGETVTVIVQTNAISPAEADRVLQAWGLGEDGSLDFRVMEKPDGSVEFIL